MNTLELTGVSKSYGRHWALRDISLRLAPGERLALLGHNGAGKTTLMKLILGLIPPNSGDVRVFGASPAIAGPQRPAIGFLPEIVAFHDAMTGREILCFYARLKRRSQTECVALLDRVGLTAAADRRVGGYSKGMRQRLGLAQALLGNPRLLLLDEPTTGLDPALRAIFYDIIGDLAAKGTSVLLSSHLLTEVEERTDRIVIMNQGRQVTAGTLDELRIRAMLPVEIRLRPNDGRFNAVASAFAALEAQPQGRGELAITCSAADKMAILTVVMAHGGDIRDIEVKQPGLDAVYAHFTDSITQGEMA